jgi:hypothetical protein
MSSKLLITFGCSWTYGVGAIWYPNIKRVTYNSFAWNADACFKYSFRNLLCQEFNLENKNFSAGGSSNQRQFRYAKEYFGSDQFKKDLDAFEQIIVFHGITDTSRNEFYSIEFQELINMQYSMRKTNKDMHTDFQKLCSEFMVKNSYNHNNEVNQLETELKFWNTFYQSYNIKNIWADTFNHHEYNVMIPNIIGHDLSQRDLMSQLAARNGMDVIDKTYHNSVWTIDSNRVDFLVKKEILNPISMHPTQEGHKQIYEIIKDYFVKNNIVT